ncbi:DUF4138 domain-containing protein [Daejeonella sp.]|uniref:DUF4138 domain-containing protein n=1 Tax=Daejeonella sp. TaxID=2805397 RepID=UPI0030C555C3
MKTYHLIMLLALLSAGSAVAQESRYTSAFNSSNKQSLINSKDLAKTIAGFKFSRLVKDKEGNISADLNKVLIHQGSFYFKFRLSNRSPIPYDIDFIRFYIRDLKAAKRTVTQEQEVYPEPVFGKELVAVAPMDRKIKVFRLTKFTVPDDKALFIEVYEKNGARHVYLKVSRSDIENARTVK